jgi:hypothetical protein
MKIIQRFAIFLGLMIPAVALAGDPVKDSCCPSCPVTHCPFCNH